MLRSSCMMDPEYSLPSSRSSAGISSVRLSARPVMSMASLVSVTG